MTTQGVSVRDTIRSTEQLGGNQAVNSSLKSLPVSIWPTLARLLSAKDLLCLSLSSRAVSQALCSVTGLWRQICDCYLGWACSSDADCHMTLCVLLKLSRHVCTYGCAIKPCSLRPPPGIAAPGRTKHLELHTTKWAWNLSPEELFLLCRDGVLGHTSKALTCNCNQCPNRTLCCSFCW